MISSSSSSTYASPIKTPAAEQPVPTLPQRRSARVRPSLDAATPSASPTAAAAEAVDLEGVCLHRSPPIAARDRQSLARVVGYVTRPLVHPAAITRPSESKVALRLQRPGRDGVTQLEFSTDEFERRLAEVASLGTGRAVSYHGALATGGASGAGARQLDLVSVPALTRGAPRPRWRCSGCGGRVEVVALERIA